MTVRAQVCNIDGRVLGHAALVLVQVLFWGAGDGAGACLGNMDGRVIGHAALVLVQLFWGAGDGAGACLQH